MQLITCRLGEKRQGNELLHSDFCINNNKFIKLLYRINTKRAFARNDMDLVLALLGFMSM